MTRLELELILKTIDCHTKTYSSNYYNGSDIKRIDDVVELKRDIIKSYEQYMKEEN